MWPIRMEGVMVLNVWNYLLPGSLFGPNNELLCMFNTAPPYFFVLVSDTTVPQKVAFLLLKSKAGPFFSVFSFLCRSSQKDVSNAEYPLSLFYQQPLPSH